MSTGLSQDFKEQVRSHTDLVALVAESVDLRPTRGGADFEGLCPFHDDHNPSFHVYPDRQTYRCWVCDEGGDCFSWVMHHEAVEFREALEMLARKANLEMPNRPRDQASQTRRASIYDVLEWAESEFEQYLLTDAAAEPARRYLAQRGIDEAAIRKFHLGYHPEQWEWLIGRARGRFDISLLAAARLVQERNDSRGYYDSFVGRVLFPIRDMQRRCVAFGGRILPGASRQDAPKYLNSVDSEVFSKSHLLYGLDQARDAIRSANTAIIVEGYTDCIMAHLHGVEHVVATLGTALTEHHIRLLKRFARKIVLVYDGDAAGQAASERALSRFLAQEVDVRILSLPNHADPADFLATHGRDVFCDLAEQAIEAWEYKLQSSERRFGTKTIDARQQVLEDMAQTMSQAPGLAGSVKENLIINRIVRRLEVGETVIRQELAKHRRSASSTASRKPARVEPAQLPSSPETLTLSEQAHEREIIEIVLACPSLVDQIRTQVGIEDFRGHEYGQLWQAILDLLEERTELNADQLLSHLENIQLKRAVVRLDQSAREKQLALKIEHNPSLLEQALTNLTWRREHQYHQEQKGRLAETAATATALGDDMRALLELATQHNQKRATRSSTPNN